MKRFSAPLLISLAAFGLCLVVFYMQLSAPMPHRSPLSASSAERAGGPVKVCVVVDQILQAIEPSLEFDVAPAMVADTGKSST